MPRPALLAARSPRNRATRRSAPPAALAVAAAAAVASALLAHARDARA